jgi:exonuclease SbcD
LKLLHTSDWHVGKTLRGQSRAGEHEAVLAEIVEIARRETVDVALVAGDLFETAAPAPEATRLVLRTLLDLRDAGAEVVVISGNHDNPANFEALRPLAAEAGITMRGRVARPDDGGVIDLVTRDGETLRIALVPFTSQRSIVRGAELLAGDAASNAGTYAERMRQVLETMTASFDPTRAVNVVLTHCMVRGGRLGVGERDAQTFEDYYVDPSAFGTVAHYVALGHLHLTQGMHAGCPVWYSGSPIQVDFGEEGDDKHVLIVEAVPGKPASAPRKVRLQAPRRLRTLRGSLSELGALATAQATATADGDTGGSGDAGGGTGDALRIYVREKARAGLAEEVRALFPNAVDVMIDPTDSGASPVDGEASATRRPQGPTELFKAFLDHRGVDDDRVEALFAKLLDDATTSHQDGEQT